MQRKRPAYNRHSGNSGITPDQWIEKLPTPMRMMDATHMYKDQPRLTRAEARAAGLSRYFTGQPCPKGHVAERYTNNYSCVVCYREPRNRLVVLNVRSDCKICGCVVPSRGRVTCSTVCRNEWKKVKSRIKSKARELRKSLQLKKTCNICDELLGPGKIKYCSDGCAKKGSVLRQAEYDKSKKLLVEPTTYECEFCHNTFQALAGNRKYCSPTCRGKRKRARSEPRYARKLRSASTEEYRRKRREESKRKRMMMRAALIIESELLSPVSDTNETLCKLPGEVELVCECCKKVFFYHRKIKYCSHKCRGIGWKQSNSTLLQQQRKTAYRKARDQKLWTTEEVKAGKRKWWNERYAVMKAVKELGLLD